MWRKIIKKSQDRMVSFMGVQIIEVSVVNINATLNNSVSNAYDRFVCDKKSLNCFLINTISAFHFSFASTLFVLVFSALLIFKGFDEFFIFLCAWGG